MATDDTAALVADLERHLSAEIANAVGLSKGGRLHRLLNPIFRLPAGRFASLLGTGDDLVRRHGIIHGAGWMANQLVVPAEVRGREHVPATGPLLVMSNHPGAYDSLVLIEALGRNDILIVISPISALMRLPHVTHHLAVVEPGKKNATSLLNRVRDHLRAGGAVLIFPGRNIDPDPDVEEGADVALDSWSRSIGLMLRSTPETRVLVAIVSSVIASGWVRSPLARLQPAGHKRRRLAEFSQIGGLILTKRRRRVAPRVSFAEPLSLDALGRELAPVELRDRLVDQARALLAEHMANAGPRPGR
jgi:1-acyl-sn-glycerol-3-phosphate acyltransferase